MHRNNHRLLSGSHKSHKYARTIYSAFRVKPGGIYSNHKALQGQYSRHLSYSGHRFSFFVYNLETWKLITSKYCKLRLQHQFLLKGTTKQFLLYSVTTQHLHTKTFHLQLYCVRDKCGRKIKMWIHTKSQTHLQRNEIRYP